MFIVLLLICALPQRIFSQKQDSTQKNTGAALVNSLSPPSKWTLVFADEFNHPGKFDSEKWTYCSRLNVPWARFLTAGSKYVHLAGGSLILSMDKDSISGDPVPYHAGGIQTSGKFSLRYGKIEVRARFNRGQGSWPAIWMMPEKPVAYGTWPNSGEIDIMEHINFENAVHQTIHNGKVTGPNGASTATHTGTYDAAGFNTYGVIWDPNAIAFYVNGVLQYSYAKATDATFREWPFDRPFYLILNQSGGAGWPGPIADADLPFIMEVDWVRVYQSAGIKLPLK